MEHTTSGNLGAKISDVFCRNGLKRNTRHGLMDQDTWFQKMLQGQSTLGIKQVV
jgi:hypothetical protein